MAVRGEDVYCTLVMNDAYLPGAAVLAHSLRDNGTKKRLAVMITPESLSADAVTELRSLYDIVIPVERIANPNPGNVFLMGRGDLLYAFTKINLWRQTQFRKIVYIDADIVALRALDELFDIDAPFAAAPDIGWPDAFNSGLMVISPNMGDFWALQTLASSGDSFDGADQGLLNQYFEHRGWHRLSFTYNCTPNAEYQWEPAYRHYKSNIKAVHFIGKDKPWMKGRQARGKQGNVYGDLVNQWWAVYDRHLKNPAYDPQRPFAQQTMVIQKNVTGETHDQFYGVPPEQRVAPPAITDIAPSLVPHQAPATPPPAPAIQVTSHEHSPHADQPLSKPEARNDTEERGRVEPPPTVQQRRFSAPHLEWDATVGAPPAESRPEAANFPSVQYDFSESKDLYRAPPSYPEPPKDMWYEVPESKPKPEEPPKPIFPWEYEHPDRPKATRRFAEDMVPEDRKRKDQKKPGSIVLPQAGAVADETFAPFSPQANAWDENPSIERYVRAVLESQQSRHRARAPNQPPEVLSPSGRRESLIITDFPSADDRPSLPVTPAPIRRPTFWGEERDEAGELPAAEGVPDQAEWNPAQKLEELRRNSLLEVQHLKSPEVLGRRLSDREMPAHAVPLPQKVASPPASERPAGSTAAAEQSLFSGPTSPHGESLQTVPEEPSSTESSHVLGGSAKEGLEGEALDPKATQSAPSVTTLEAEIAGRATATGKPVFTEPDFGPGPGPVEEDTEDVAPTGIRRSPGSFSAAALREGEQLSPTER
ncbi:hypothetical protein, variant [Verruconis gallopava]|uniref:glycogenin glucosyltransferase n=1 Tax=Verruconis gallopava TaxID=253628 RepID=A0A0D2AI10_9PEZI|nr:hypothetical protein, variant [Verruconis gallopava]KIW06235.1 hypothetical protein, variant [Verruconis gallopava]